MGQMVYVLTTLVEKKDWRPVAVVDEMHLDAANQWAAASPKNDYVPLEMNDYSLTGLGDMPMNFEPAPTPTVDQSVRELEDANARLIRIIQQLAERHKDKDILRVLERAQQQKQKRSAGEKTEAETGRVARFASRLLRRKDD